MVRESACLRDPQAGLTQVGAQAVQQWRRFSLPAAVAVAAPAHRTGQTAPGHKDCLRGACRRGSRWPSVVLPHPQAAAAEEEEVRLPPLLQASGLLRLAGTAAHRSKAAAL